MQITAYFNQGKEFYIQSKNAILNLSPVRKSGVFQAEDLALPMAQWKQLAVKEHCCSDTRR